jgi:DNA adenine methylase
MSRLFDCPKHCDTKPISGTRIVNVASVPLRSPFRYPGGKTWLVPYARRWLQSAGAAHLLEPFAGGAIIGLTAVFEDLVERATLVELDAEVGAVWQTIITDSNGPLLAERIANFTITPEAVQEAFESVPVSTVDRAFQTILRNRVNHGGILAAGAGRLKQGENGRGIASRWYPETLCKRVLDIHQLRHRLVFVAGDGLAQIEAGQADSATACFIDPPYTAVGKRAGRRLYTHNEVDHQRLFEMTATLSGNFLMTYDDHPTIASWAAHFGMAVRRVPMKNTHHACPYELLLGRSFYWLDEI